MWSKTTADHLRHCPSIRNQAISLVLQCLIFNLLPRFVIPIIKSPRKSYIVFLSSIALFKHELWPNSVLIPHYFYASLLASRGSIFSLLSVGRSLASLDGFFACRSCIEFERPAVFVDLCVMIDYDQESWSRLYRQFSFSVSVQVRRYGWILGLSFVVGLSFI